MRTPTSRMFPQTVTVERRPALADPLTGNVPLGAFALVTTMPGHCHPVDGVERQVLGTVDVPISHRVRVGACGSVILDGDRLTMSISGEKLIVQHKRNTNALNVVYVCYCHAEPA